MDNSEQCDFEQSANHFFLWNFVLKCLLNQRERVKSDARHDPVSYATCPRKYFSKSVSLFTFLLNEWLHFHYFIQNQHNMMHCGVSNPHLSLLEIQSFSFSSKAVQLYRMISQTCPSIFRVIHPWNWIRFSYFNPNPLLIFYIILTLLVLLPILFSGLRGNIWLLINHAI